MSVKDLLSTKANTFKEPPKFPAGNFKFTITDYKIGTWTKSKKIGVTFTLKATDCAELHDENPDIVEEMRAALEKFGDWTQHVHTFFYVDQDTKDNHLLVSPVTFTLFNEDESQSNGASMFYFRNPETGEYSGFVPDILGINVAQELGDDPALGDVLDACINRELWGQLEWQPQQKDPTRHNLNLLQVASA